MMEICIKVLVALFCLVSIGAVEGKKGNKNGILELMWPCLVFGRFLVPHCSLNCMRRSKIKPSYLLSFLPSIPGANLKRMSKIAQAPRKKPLNWVVLYLWTIKQKISFFYILDIETDSVFKVMLQSIVYQSLSFPIFH